MPTYQISITAEMPDFPGTPEEAAERAWLEFKKSDSVQITVEDEDGVETQHEVQP